MPSKKPTGKKKTTKKKVVKVRRLVEFPEPLLDWINAFAEEYGQSRNQVIINVLTGFRMGVESKEEGPDLEEQMTLLRQDVVSALERRLADYSPAEIRNKAAGR